VPDSHAGGDQGGRDVHQGARYVLLLQKVQMLPAGA